MIQLFKMFQLILILLGCKESAVVDKHVAVSGKFTQGTNKGNFSDLYLNYHDSTFCVQMI